jgi:amino acid transporter
MKNLLLVVSLLVFSFSGYYFISDLKYTSDFNSIIYILSWLMLVLIALIGIVYTTPNWLKRKRHFKNLTYNSYSDRRIRHKEFDEKFQFLN